MEDIGRLLVALWQYRDEILEIVGGIVLAATAVVQMMHGLLSYLTLAALKTKTKSDDAAVAKLAVFIARSVSVLDSLYKIIRPFSVRGTGDKVKNIHKEEMKDAVKSLSTPPPPPPATAKKSVKKKAA